MTVPRPVPEPALRPIARPGPGIERAHWARLFVRDGALVLRRRDALGRRVERRVPLTGPGAPRRAVVVPDPGQIPHASKARSAVAPGGEIRLLDAEGDVVALVLPEEWTPERIHRGPEESWELSGAGALLTAAGIPWTLLDRPGDQPARPRGRPAVLGPGTLLPVWYVYLRIGTAALWVTVLGVLLVHGATPPLVLMAALLACAGPGLRVVLRGVTARRNRSAGRLTPPPLFRLAPRPAPPGPGSPAHDGEPTRMPSVRFVGRAALAVLPGEVSLVDGYGADHRWPLTGPSALTGLRRVLGPDGSPVAVELRGPGDRVRAVVDWADWFGGPSGDAAWRQLAARTGLREEDHRVSAKGAALRKLKRGASSAGTHHAPAQARQRAAFPGYRGSWISVLLVSLISLGLAGGVRAQSPVTAGLCVLLAVSAVLLQAVPWLWFELRSRLFLERPYRREAP